MLLLSNKQHLIRRREKKQNIKQQLLPVLFFSLKRFYFSFARRNYLYYYCYLLRLIAVVDIVEVICLIVFAEKVSVSLQSTNIYGSLVK